MSVVAAILDLEGRPVDRAAIERMAEASVAAGPDRRGVWVKGPVALAHRLLATTPESRGARQPRALGEDLWISADLRLDNRDELAQRLGAAGEDFDPAAATDDEYVLRAYRVWGAECLPWLLGDFALVLWDARRRQLLGGRDCFGIRPLHFCLHDGRLRVGSMISQILADPAVDRTHDEETVEDFLIAGCRRSAAATFYRAIRSVPPGHVLRATPGGGISVTPYWGWRAPREIRYRRREDYADHLREVFGRAVSARLRAVGPVGLMLSGGLDSGAVAGVGTDLLRRAGRSATTLRGYSFVYDDLPSMDERQYIKPLVDALGIESVFIYPEWSEAFATGVLADEPDGSDASDQRWTAALRDLKAHGGRVMLTGGGGETLLLSQSRHHFVDWLLTARWRVLARELRAYRRLNGHWPSIDWRAVIGRAMPQWLYERWPVTFRDRGEPPWLTMTPARQRRRVRRWRRARSRRVFQSFARQAALERLAGVGSTTSLWAFHAEIGQRVGMEYAHPFMDRRLHEYVLAVPLAQFFDGGLDRAVMRRALRGLVPDEVRLRLRQTYADEWFTSHPPRDALRRVLRESSIPAMTALFSPGPVASAEAALELDAYRYQRIWLALFLAWANQSTKRTCNMKDEHPVDRNERGEEPAEAKRPYRTPRLRQYGRIEQLTLALGTSGADGGVMANQMRV